MNMNELELYEKLRDFFPSRPKLMIHLSPGALWKYEVNGGTLDDPQPALTFWLEKVSDDEILMHELDPGKRPDRTHDPKRKSGPTQHAVRL